MARYSGGQAVVEGVGVSIEIAQQDRPKEDFVVALIAGFESEEFAGEDLADEGADAPALDLPSVIDSPQFDVVGIDELRNSAGHRTG